jgi:hypothetical protein
VAHRLNLVDTGETLVLRRERCRLRAPYSHDDAQTFGPAIAPGIPAPRPRLARPGAVGASRSNFRGRRPPNRISVGVRTRIRLARRTTWGADHSTDLRPAATAHAGLAAFRRTKHPAHAGVRLALVAGWWTFVSGHSTAAMEFRPTRDHSGGRRLSHRSLRRDGAGTRYCPGSARWRCAGVTRAMAPRLIEQGCPHTKPVPTRACSIARLSSGSSDPARREAANLAVECLAVGCVPGAGTTLLAFRPDPVLDLLPGASVKLFLFDAPRRG